MNKMTVKRATPPKTRHLRQLLDVGGVGAPLQLVVRTIMERGALSAADIARVTGLARSTVSTALSELRGSGIVVEADSDSDGDGKQQPKKSAGRPATALKLNPEAGTCVGIHLAYEGVEVVLADISHSFIAEQKIALGADYEPRDVVGPIVKAVDGFYRAGGLAPASLLGVGVSVSGPVRPDGVLQRGGILPRWAGVNIREMFANSFGQQVVTDNESNCAAVAEMKWGAARGYDNFVIFKMDVGVGGAIVSNGALVKGVAGGAGEFGHVSIDAAGDLCRCGNRGCLELYASFARPLEQLARVHRRAMTMDDAIALAEAGDAGALRVIADVGDYGGRGLAMIGTILNPPLILVGGRMALAGDLLLTPMRAAFERHALIKQIDSDAAGSRTQIRVGRFTENDSLLGAVGLVLDNHQAMATGSDSPLASTARR